MRRPSPTCATAALLAALGIGTPPPAAAQTDPAALQLIEQLRPRGGGTTRGIRLPTPADAGAPAATPPATPVVAVPAPVAPPPAVQAPPPQAIPPQAIPQQPRPAPRPSVAAINPATTAPPGVAAVSITVTFPTGSATLTLQAEAVLAPLGRALSSADLAPFRFRIEGHTDSVGDAARNMMLSERRAQAVRDYLVNNHGVAPSRLEALGLGETRLLVATGDGVDEPRNRRVQVVNLDD